jgi:hypothetical protein
VDFAVPVPIGTETIIGKIIHLRPSAVFRISSTRATSSGTSTPTLS